MKHLDATPWAARALGEQDSRVLDEKAGYLGCEVNVLGGSPVGPWTVRVWSRSSTVRVAIHHAKGPVAVAVNAGLDQWAAEKAAVDADLARIGFPGYSPDELVQIAAQSGIEVSRA